MHRFTAKTRRRLSPVVAGGASEREPDEEALLAEAVRLALSPLPPDPGPAWRPWHDPPAA